MRLLTAIRQKSSALAAASICLSLAGCACEPEQIAVPTPVPVPGPVQYVPIPAALTQCDDTGEPPAVGQPLGELFAWAQRTRAASLACQGKLEELRQIGPRPDSVK